MVLRNIGVPELIIIVVLIIAVVSLVRAIRKKRPNSSAIPPTLPDPLKVPLIPSSPTVRGVTLNSQEERLQAATEIVHVPVGVSVTVKRGRTIEHNVEINWRTAVSGQVEAGLKQLVNVSIVGELERTRGRVYKESETIEYEVALQGTQSGQYKLVWTDVWLHGVTELEEDGRTQYIPFRFRERTELVVASV